MTAARIGLGLCCFAVVGMIAWLSRAEPKPTPASWEQIAPGILRTTSKPYGYALVDGPHALLIDCPLGSEGLKKHGVTTVDQVLLTHHHRDAVAAVSEYLDAKIPVRGPKASADLLGPAGVKKYWDENFPLRNSRTNYFMVAEGFAGLDLTIDDGSAITWRGRTLKAVATPGHSRDHYSYVLADKEGDVLFAGDALSDPGKMWTPFTTDWDHWTDAGLKPAYESLRKLAALKPVLILSGHGEPIRKNAPAVLSETADLVEEVGFLKSFERFTKRLGDVPTYKFLVNKEQIASGGDKPWSKVSDHLFITGNTYVLVSKQDKAVMVLDPWGQRSVDQLKKLIKDEGLGAIELVMFSHAHYDHFDGVYLLPDRERFKVWSLDRVADPIAHPFQRRAPFLDARAVKFDRTFRDGEKGVWREFEFRFHHFPGQTEFTMAVEAVIDGKKCLFTADNFFHQDQFSGSGGWMGLNRSYPLPYAESAAKVVDLAPEWILAEHGGPYEYSAEDYRRRARWGKATAAAADKISPSGSHRRDWDLNRIAVEPLVFTAAPGDTIRGTLVVSNPADSADRVSVAIDGRKAFAGPSWSIDLPAGATVRKPFELTIPAGMKSGRFIALLRNRSASGGEVCDSFLAIDVK